MSQYRAYFVPGATDSVGLMALGPDDFNNPDDIFPVVNSSDPTFNCHGFALGTCTHIDGSRPPTGVTNLGPRLPHELWYEDVMKKFGYSKSTNCDFECGKTKIAYYGEIRNPRKVRYPLPRGPRVEVKMVIKHSATQTLGCNWASKLGDEEIVSHDDVNSIAGALYGALLGCYEKDDKNMCCGDCPREDCCPFFKPYSGH